MRVAEQGTLYKQNQMIQNMRSLCGEAQSLGMLVGMLVSVTCELYLGGVKV